jgi:hypothetical protein
MNVDKITGIFSGKAFPDLKKAFAAKGIRGLIEKIPEGDSIYEPANEKKRQLEKQYRGDFKASVQSHAVAVRAGNKNACLDKKQFGELSESQQTYSNKVTKAVSLPSYGRRKFAAKKLPKNRGVSPLANSAGRQPLPPSMRSAKVGQGSDQSSAQYRLETVRPQQLDGKDNFKLFVGSQAGFKGKTIDKSLSFTHDGTPQYGDDELNQANQDNLSANLANTPPTLDIPQTVKSGATVDANKIERAQPAQTQDRGDTVGSMLKLGAIALVVTALLFLLRDILGVVAFITNVASLTSTVTNIAQTFLAIFDSLASLLGLGEDTSKPISETFDGILNNAFGKEKVDYVKYNLARVNTVFNAGANILNRTRSISQNLAAGIEENAQNTSKIGNAMRRAGVVDEQLRVMDEQIAVNVDKSPLKLLNDKLTKAANVSSELAGVTTDMKTSKDELKNIEAEKVAREKEAKEKQTTAQKADKEAAGKDVELPNLTSRGI